MKESNFFPRIFILLKNVWNAHPELCLIFRILVRSHTGLCWEINFTFYLWGLIILFALVFLWICSKQFIHSPTYCALQIWLEIVTIKNEAFLGGSLISSCSRTSTSEYNRFKSSTLLLWGMIQQFKNSETLCLIVEYKKEWQRYSIGYSARMELELALSIPEKHLWYLPEYWHLLHLWQRGKGLNTLVL